MEVGPTFLTRFVQAFVDASIPLDPSELLDADRELLDIDGLDSVSRVRLAMSLETTFRIEISPGQNSKLVTIGDLITLIQTKIAEANSKC